VSVGVFFVIVINVAANEDVSDAFEVSITRYIFSIHDRETDLVVFYWLWGDVPYFLLFTLFVTWFNLEPACEHTLGK